jgi:hypothetical protein
MNSNERQEVAQDLAAVVADIHFQEAVLNLLFEGFSNRTGIYVSIKGAPDEFTMTGYVKYLEYLKNNIETMKSIIQYLDATKSSL